MIEKLVKWCQKPPRSGRMRAMWEGTIMGKPILLIVLVASAGLISTGSLVVFGVLPSIAQVTRPPVLALKPSAQLLGHVSTSLGTHPWDLALWDCSSLGRYNVTWTYKMYDSTSEIDDTCIGDVDNDGQKEVVALASSWTCLFERCGLNSFDLYELKLWFLVWDSGATEQPTFSSSLFGFEFEREDSTSMAIGDADNNPSNGQEVIVCMGNCTAIFRYLAVSGARDFELVWKSPDLTRRVVFAKVWDSDSDGENELLTVAMGSGEITVWTYRTGSWIEEGRLPELRGGPAGLVIFYDLAIGDIDNDGRNEVVAVGSFGQIAIFGYNRDGYALEWISEPLNPFVQWGTTQSVALGDLDGDGTKEIFIGCSGYPATSIRIYAYEFNQVTQAYDRVWSPLHESVGPDKMKIADLDSDTKPELVVGGSGYLRIFRFVNGEYVAFWSTETDGLRSLSIG